ncbi:MAG: dienelactone hydrolase family protein [Synechococcus sp.]|nr:dienelactone hydrolase family protein [Synechococcus sp.]
MSKRYLWSLPLLLGASLHLPAQAQVTANPFVYEIENQPFEGYIARNEGFGNNQPIVLLIHDWDGLNTYEKMRANMLSTQGYTVVALDLYGQGVRPKNVAESQAESGKLYGDRQLMRERLLAGLEVAKQLDGVDPEKVAIMGYCFGGAAVLELARAGAELDGFISFHGGLALPEGQDYSQTQGPMLILHGSADPVSPIAEVAALATDLNKAGVTYDMEIYGGGLHSFTKWDSDDYDPQADLKSWAELLEFLKTVF